MHLLFYVFLHALWCDVRVSMWVYVHLQVCGSLYMWKPEAFYLVIYLFFGGEQVSGLTGVHQWLLQTKQVSLKSFPVSTFPALELLLYIVLLLTQVLGTQLMSTHLYTTRAGWTGSAPQTAPMIF